MKEYLKKYPYWLAVPAILAVILFSSFPEHLKKS